MTAPSARRWAITAGSIGLVAGLGLGVTGLASATSPAGSAATTASPSPGQAAQDDKPAREHRAGKPGGPRLREGYRQGHGQGYGQGPGGLVSAINADSLTVRTPKGTRTVKLNGSTAFYEGPTKATASAVSVGEVVHIRLVDPRATDPVAAVVRVVPAMVAGWIATIEGNRITVIDRDGFTRVIATGSGTDFRKDGAKSTASALAVGTFVHAVGSVAADGTTLEATRVGTGRPGPKGARGAGDDGAPAT